MRFGWLMIGPGRAEAIKKAPDHGSLLERE